MAQFTQALTFVQNVALVPSQGSPPCCASAFSPVFTLIELMAVVAIVAILPPSPFLRTKIIPVRAQVSEGMVLASGAKAAVWNHVSNKGTFPLSIQSAGLAKNTSIIGNYVSSLDVADGVIKVVCNRPKANAHIISTGRYLLFSPLSNASCITWTRTPSTLDPQYLPTICPKQARQNPKGSDAEAPCDKNCHYLPTVDHAYDRKLVTFPAFSQTAVTSLAAYRDERHNPNARTMREYTSGSCGTLPASLCRELPGRS